MISFNELQLEVAYGKIIVREEKMDHESNAVAFEIKVS